MAHHDYEPVIGLEVHCQLATHSKAFCGCQAKPFKGQTVSEVRPNVFVCPICAGHPGTLPVLNKTVVDFAIQAGLATNCTIQPESVFARKNYFYPDLPKGYQISQHEHPICTDGYLEFEVDHEKIRVDIERIHIEEDAGKNIHMAGFSVINLNRAGVPLIEIVSRPQIRSAKQASEYLKTLHSIVTYLEICDGNMQEGNFRCDANVSVRKKGTTALGVRTEIKNVNSFRFVEKAIEYEIGRQIECLENQERIIMETRMYDAASNKTISMRSKETAQDYRYFPEPNLPPLVIPIQWVEALRAQLPELAHQKKARFIQEYDLNGYDSHVLTAQKNICHIFEQAILMLEAKGFQKKNIGKTLCNLITSEVLRVLNEKNIEIQDTKMTPEHLADCVECLVLEKISATAAKQILTHVFENGHSVAAIIAKTGLLQINDARWLENLIDEVIAQNVKQVADYRSGKDKLFGFFVGQCMKKSAGKANPVLLNELLKQKLNA
jgi:aspartyl-tRNA(Asn)/glutamyl-tRNA(Gln) amidotransferase subunit B